MGRYLYSFSNESNIRLFAYALDSRSLVFTLYLILTSMYSSNIGQECKGCWILEKRMIYRLYVYVFQDLAEVNSGSCSFQGIRKEHNSNCILSAEHVYSTFFFSPFFDFILLLSVIFYFRRSFFVFLIGFFCIISLECNICNFKM